jgi:hypothetical protein
MGILLLRPVARGFGSLLQVYIPLLILQLPSLSLSLAAALGYIPQLLSLSLSLVAALACIYDL